MLIRYFAAAAQAAGTSEERLNINEGTTTTLGDVLGILTAREPAAPPISDGPLLRKATSLGTVLTRCSFLINGTSEQDHGRELAPGDILDVLPPFAGG
ncbi:molybdopterin synthase sulfur carrier subunit [Arthrobacter sp. 7749]|nr:molybdopterin synthase sulfur carrier subunit [Arthrobacter sp. 7749]